MESLTTRRDPPSWPPGVTTLGDHQLTLVVTKPPTEVTHPTWAPKWPKEVTTLGDHPPPEVTIELISRYCCKKPFVWQVHITSAAIQAGPQLSCWQGGVGPTVVGYSWYAPRQRQSMERQANHRQSGAKASKDQLHHHTTSPSPDTDTHIGNIGKKIKYRGEILLVKILFILDMRLAGTLDGRSGNDASSWDPAAVSCNSQYSYNQNISFKSNTCWHVDHIQYSFDS